MDMGAHTCLTLTLPQTSHSHVHMQFGKTPLHHTKSAEVAKVLLHAKANVNAKSKVSVHDG